MAVTDGWTGLQQSDFTQDKPAPLEATFETMAYVVRQCKKLTLHDSATYLQDLKRQIELLQQR
jgi:hypothetical protein